MVKLLIYIVEDNEVYTMMLNEKLRHTLVDYNLRTFTSGEACLKDLDDPPDMIILDYYLQGENGLTILKRIRQINPNIPVIILSKQKDIHIAVKLLQEGASDYIVKGQDAYIELNSAINRIVAQKNLEKENIVLKLKINKNRVLVGIMIIVVIALAVSSASLLL